MANRARPTRLKREKEKARVERRKEKETRRREAKGRRPLPRREGEEDPDLAGIVAGPQPLPEELAEVLEDSDES
jgi:hypothetical protein